MIHIIPRPHDIGYAYLFNESKIVSKSKDVYILDSSAEL